MRRGRLLATLILEVSDICFNATGCRTVGTRLYGHRFRRIVSVSVCAIIGSFSSATTARAQVDFETPTAAEAQSIAAKSSPELENGLAQELGSTPEQAAGTAGVLLGLAKSFLKPDDFAALSKAVPGMDSLLAAGRAGRGRNVQRIDGTLAFDADARICVVVADHWTYDGGAGRDGIGDSRSLGSTLR